MHGNSRDWARFLVLLLAQGANLLGRSARILILGSSVDKAARSCVDAGRWACLQVLLDI